MLITDMNVNFCFETMQRAVLMCEPFYTEVFYNKYRAKRQKRKYVVQKNCRVKEEVLLII